MTGILALVIVLIAMSLGDIISIKTKAFVPSVFITALIFRNASSWIGDVSTGYSHGNIDEC